MGSRLFGYNSGATVSGASQSGNLAVSNDSRGGGSVQWWNGPDEDLGYVIGYTDTTGLRKANGTLIGGNSLGFIRTLTKTDAEFLSLSNSLTSQGFMTASVAVNWLNTNGYYTSYSASVDTDAQAFITAAGITDSTQKTAINTLVVGLKADGLWTKLYAIYPIVGGTDSTHKYNLKDPRNLDVANRLLFNGGITHSSNGMLFNGTNGWAEIALSNGVNCYSFGCYTRNSTDNGGDYMGSQYAINFYPEDPESSDTYLSGYHVNYGIYEISDVYGIQSTANTIRTGLSSVVYDAGQQKFYKNGILKANNQSYSTGYVPGVPIINLGIGATNPNSIGYPLNTFSNQQITFSFIGSVTLTNTDNDNLYTRVQAFQTTLSRQV